MSFATALGMDTRGLNLVVSLPSNAVYLTNTNYGRGEGGREAALESLTSQCSSILLVITPLNHDNTDKSTSWNDLVTTELRMGLLSSAVTIERIIVVVTVSG